MLKTSHNNAFVASIAHFWCESISNFISLIVCVHVMCIHDGLFFYFCRMRAHLYARRLKTQKFSVFFPFHSFICKHIFRWCALPVWRRMLSILECLPLLLLFFGFCFALLCVYICVPQNASFATISRCDFICDCDTWTLPIFMYFVQF